ncbi:MAG: PH domain-containing protein [Candidatus Woesebacteria bacterium]|jgi:hypothetical protein
MPKIFDAQEEKHKSQKTMKSESHKRDHQHETQTHENERQEQSPKTHKGEKKQAQRKHVDEYSEILRKEKPETNHLKSFVPKPEKVFFDSQLDQEKVILLLRSHPITLVKKFLIAAVIFFLPILMLGSGMLDFFPWRYKLAASIMIYLVLVGFLIESFLMWFFSVYIITDERIIDVDFLSLLFKNISSAKIDNIEDITSATGGFLASMVDYGTVYIQTAGESRELEFENVPQPAKVTAILNELILEEEQEKIEGRVR